MITDVIKTCDGIDTLNREENSQSFAKFATTCCGGRITPAKHKQWTMVFDTVTPDSATQALVGAKIVYYKVKGTQPCFTDFKRQTYHARWINRDQAIKRMEDHELGLRTSRRNELILNNCSMICSEVDNENFTNIVTL